MTTLSPVAEAPVTMTPSTMLTISREAGKVLLDDLDFQLEELLNLHVMGGYVKKSEVMDLLLDFRQTIDNFPTPEELLVS